RSTEMEQADVGRAHEPPDQAGGGDGHEGVLTPPQEREHRYIVVRCNRGSAIDPISGSQDPVDPGLAVDGASYCPAFVLLDDDGDETFAAALGRTVTDGCPEPRPDETGARWWAVTAIAGVATDDEGRPAHGEDANVVRLGQGKGVLLVTDQAAACAIKGGKLHGGAAALALSFDLDEVAAVEADRKRTLRGERVRSFTVELRGASWGGVGFAVAGELARQPGTSGAPVE